MTKKIRNGLLVATACLMLAGAKAAWADDEMMAAVQRADGSGRLPAPSNARIHFCQTDQAGTIGRRSSRNLISMASVRSSFRSRCTSYRAGNSSWRVL